MIDIDSWLPADGFTLEPNALRAAKEQKRNLAILAGPGTGKTEMLAQRADFLLRTGCCRYPKRILAISFKIDASKNLKERVLRRCGRYFASRLDSHTFHAFAKRIIDRFRPVLVGDDALDADYTIGEGRFLHKQVEFGDLVPLAIQILEQSKLARNAVRQTYSDVFLDEFQDCTSLQYKLVRIAFQGTAIRLTAVGDTKQVIMKWAGALDGVFNVFAKDFGAIPLNMYRNFRSQPQLLRMQNEIIRVLDPDSVMPEEQMTGEGGEVYAWQFDDGREEAKYLAELIASWVRIEQIPLSEIAVLVSKQLDLYADHLMTELKNQGIPYRNEQQMQDIAAEPAARLIVDYLSCLYGEREPNAWIRLMNQLTPFAGDETQSSIRQNFQHFIKIQREENARTKSAENPFSEWCRLVKIFMEKVGTETLVALSPDYETRARLKDVIDDTMARVEELLKIEPELTKALKRFSDDQTVRILTIHKSKGLEFDSVIIMAVENEIFFGNADENRCAFFVGVSRAKRRLVLTHSNQRERPDGYKKRWDLTRTAQAEYFGYATPFLSQHL